MRMRMESHPHPDAHESLGDSREANTTTAVSPKGSTENYRYVRHLHRGGGGRLARSCARSYLVPHGLRTKGFAVNRRNALILTLAALAPTALRARPAPPRWKEGTHFSQLPQPSAALAVRPGAIAVNEVFRYSCGSCFAFEEGLEKWISGLPDDVAFTRTPVAWTTSQKGEALLALTLREMRLEQLHRTVYDSIHRSQRPLSAPIEADSIRLQADFLRAHGIDPARFDQVRKSAAVQSAMALSQRFVHECRVVGTPTMVVDGRYTITVGQAGGFPQLLMITTYLLGRERSRRSASSSSG